MVLYKTGEKAQTATQLTETVLKQMELCLDESEIVSFERGFKFLGVIFLHGETFIPFGKEKKPKKIIHMPPPLNIKAYLAGLYPRRDVPKRSDIKQ